MSDSRKRRETAADALRTEPEQTPPDDWVTVARVVRPRGVRGELLADILTDFPERFAERRRLYLRAAGQQAVTQEAQLENHWLHQGRVVLKFAGVDSMTDAELLRGLEVVIPRGERAPLEEGAVYIGDLAGCMLYDRASSAVVGEIVDVDRESGSMDLLVVQPAAGEELLIPFAHAYAPLIDLEGRRMEMTLPDGLLALDEPRAASSAAQKPSTRARRKQRS